MTTHVFFHRLLPMPNFARIRTLLNHTVPFCECHIQVLCPNYSLFGKLVYDFWFHILPVVGRWKFIKNAFKIGGLLAGPRLQIIV